MRIAICDDEETAVKSVCGIVQRWADARKYNAAIETFSSAECFLFHYVDDKRYDILLLDVEMKEMDGVTMAARVRQEDDAVQIIFITGYSDYIAEGYEVEALHYLMKPVKEEKLFQVLDRAVVKLLRNERMLDLETNGEMKRISFCKIRYVDVDRNYTTVHANGDYTVKRSLGEFEKELDDRFYLWVGR